MSDRQMFTTTKYRNRVTGEVWKYCTRVGDSGECPWPLYLDCEDFEHASTWHCGFDPERFHSEAAKEMADVSHRQRDLVRGHPDKALLDPIIEEDYDRTDLHQRQTQRSTKDFVDREVVDLVDSSEDEIDSDRRNVDYQNIGSIGQALLQSSFAVSNSGDDKDNPEVEASHRLVQKLVMVHPAGLMTDKRKSDLEHCGTSQFRGGHSMKSMQVTHQYGVPSDIHMFWEGSCAFASDAVTSLSVALVGNAEPPNLSEYANTVKKISFLGHIYRMTTAVQMVMQLKACEKVEFVLGSKEQNNAYCFDDDDVLLTCCGNNVSLNEAKNNKMRSVSIKSSVSQTAQRVGSEKSAIKKIVLKQIETILSVGARIWPNVENMTVDLPGEGVYLDLVKQHLSLWGKVRENFHVELKDLKICLGKRNFGVVKQVEEQGRENVNCRRGRGNDDKAANVSNVAENTTPVAYEDQNMSTQQQRCVDFNTEVHPTPDLRTSSNLGSSIAAVSQLHYTPTPVPDHSQYDRRDPVIEDTPSVDIVERDDGFKVSFGLGDLRSRIRNRQSLESTVGALPPQVPYDYSATLDPDSLLYNSTQYPFVNGSLAAFTNEPTDVNYWSSHLMLNQSTATRGFSQDSFTLGSSLEQNAQSQSTSESDWACTQNDLNSGASYSGSSQVPTAYSDNSAHSFNHGVNGALSGTQFAQCSNGDTASDSLTFKGPYQLNNTTTSPSSGRQGWLKEDKQSHRVSPSSSHEGSQGKHENQDRLNTSIIIMGIPENYSEFELNGIMKRIIPSWTGRVVNNRIGMGVGGRPRPLKVTLRSNAEVELALQNSKRRPLFIASGSRLSVKKYVPQLDKNKKYVPKRDNKAKGGNTGKPRYPRVQGKGRNYFGSDHHRQRHQRSSSSDRSPKDLQN